MADYPIFANRLKQAMALRGKKQVDLIRAADGQGIKLGKSYVSQYVSGKTVPRADIMCFLAQALQVDVAWLRGETPAKHWGQIKRWRDNRCVHSANHPS